MTEATPLAFKANETVVVFETKVSALFWVLAIDTLEGGDGDYEDVVVGGNMSMGSSQRGSSLIIDQSDDKTVIGTVAGSLYDELVCPPYMARIVVMHKPRTPHAWCDTLLVFCVTDDKAFDLAAPPPATATAAAASAGGGSHSISCSTLRYP